METIALRDPLVPPTDKILEDILGESYPVFSEMIVIITAPSVGLVHEWRYYNDGKAWLCKVVFKKKTVFWLSAWDQYFRISFYFTEKNAAGIEDLSISKELKDSIRNDKPAGKLLPLVFEMRHKDQIPDLLKVIEYKKSLK